MTAREVGTVSGAAPARQAATVRGWPCPKCKAEPCTCSVAMLDFTGLPPSPLRRYDVGDGVVLNLDDHHARAMGLLEPDPAE